VLEVDRHKDLLPHYLSVAPPSFIAKAR
jgi:hypothetical protein